MNFGAIRINDIANGPGIRTSLFVSGCTHHCKGCFQPQTWDFDYGDKFDENALVLILNSLSPKHVRGLTILGGEPFEFENQSTVYLIAMTIHFNCDKCGCIWVTDEVKRGDGTNFYMFISDCPCCGKKDVNAKGYMG